MRGWARLSALCLLLALRAAAASGQDAQELADGCAFGGGDPALCGALAVGARALAADLGLAAGLGSEVAGSASNLGQRLGTAPRVAFGLRVGTVGTQIPDVHTGDGAGVSSFGITMLTVDVGAGLFDGFRIMPTVGGFLALDVYGRFSAAFLPSAEGFDRDQTGYAFGARVGLLREGFTLPGVSVSVSRRFLNDIRFGGQPFLGDALSFWIGPGVTSLRGTVGKHLWAVEWLGGVGLDFLSTEVAYEVQEAGGPSFVARRASLDESRWLYFVGASRDLGVIFSLSVEAGLARGFGPITQHTGSFDPGRSTFFASGAFRLTI